MGFSYKNSKGAGRPLHAVVTVSAVAGMAVLYACVSLACLSRLTGPILVFDSNISGNAAMARKREGR